MNNQKRIIKYIKETTGQANLLGYPRIYKDITGGVKAAIFLNQCVYWSDKGRRSDGFFYKSDKEWANELGLSAGVVERIRKDLEELGFIHTDVKRAYGAPTTHYLVDIPFLEKSIKQFCEKQQSEMPETKESDLVKIYKSTTENTKQNTRQNKTETISVESVSLLHSGKESLSSDGEAQVYTQHIDPDVLSDWEERSTFPGIILEISGATSLTIEEKERLYMIQASLYDIEIDAEGYDEATTWSSDKYELKYVQEKLDWARGVFTKEGRRLKPASIISAIDKFENRQTWRRLERSRKRKAKKY